MITKREMSNLKVHAYRQSAQDEFRQPYHWHSQRCCRFSGHDQYGDINDQNPEMDKLEFPKFRNSEMITDAGGKLYACRLSTDMFQLHEEDLYEGVEASSAN